MYPKVRRVKSRPRPIIHIGYHKTATTWFQNKIWPSLPDYDFVPRHAAQSAFLAPSGMHFRPEEAASLLELATRVHPVVISEENLSGYIHNGGLHGLMAPEVTRRLFAVFPDAQIVIFVRNQLDIVRASYSQYVSGGGTFSFRRYLNSHAYVHGALTRPYKAPVFEWEHFEYDRLIAYYDQLFGRRNVHVYPYERLRDPADLLATMESDLGISFPAGVASTRPYNRSQPVAAMQIMRFVNLFTRQSVVNKNWIIDMPGGQALRHGAKFLLKAVDGPPFQLPHDLASEIRARYAPSNRQLRNLRDLDLGALGYPLPVEDDTVPEDVAAPSLKVGVVAEATEPTGKQLVEETTR